MSEDMTGDVSGWTPDPSEPAPDESYGESPVGEAYDEPADHAPQDHEPGDPEPGEGADLAAAAPHVPVERTGNPVVDSVLDSLRDLENVPVSEHVAVFEAAHDRLRNALSDAGDPRTDG